MPAVLHCGDLIAATTLRLLLALGLPLHLVHGNHLGELRAAHRLDQFVELLRVLERLAGIAERPAAPSASLASDLTRLAPSSFSFDSRAFSQQAPQQFQSGIGVSLMSSVLHIEFVEVR